MICQTHLLVKLQGVRAFDIQFIAALLALVASVSLGMLLNSHSGFLLPVVEMMLLTEIGLFVERLDECTCLSDPLLSCSWSLPLHGTS